MIVIETDAVDEPPDEPLDVPLDVALLPVDPLDALLALLEPPEEDPLDVPVLPVEPLDPPPPVVGAGVPV